MTPPPPPRIPPHTHPHTPHQLRSENRSHGYTPDSTAKELDALADLFLGSSSTHHSSEQHESISPMSDRCSCELEGVLLGHLPVYAAAWPMQYARVRADIDKAPVMMIRLTANRLMVDLVGTPAFEETIEPLDARSAIALGAAQARCCLFRVDEVDECQLWDLALLDRYAILTGSNDAAVVSCYRSLKALAQHALEHDQPLPSMHLVIMGSNRTQSLQIHERIARASKAFLETKLSKPTIIERISPVKTHKLYHGPNQCSLATIAAMVRDESVRTNLGKQTHTPPDPSSGYAHMPPAQHTDNCDNVSSSQSTTATTNNHTTTTQPPATPQDIPIIQSCPTINGRFDQSANNCEAEQVETRPTEPISCLLSTLVGGLSPLVSRCPYEPGVELATDDDGTLHLLAGAFEHAATDAICNPIERLLIVRSWAQQHATLLGRAEPRLTLSNQTKNRRPPQLHSVMHVLLEDMSRARSLAMTDIHVHIVVKADSNLAQCGWRVISMQ